MFVEPYILHCRFGGRGERKEKANIPDHIAMKQQPRHRPDKHAIDLAHLRELQRARRPRQQEAHDDENGIVQDADGDVFGEQGEERGHEEGGDEHAADQAEVEHLGLLARGADVGGGFRGESVAGEVGAEDDEDEGDGDVAGLLDGTGDAIVDEGGGGEEEGF